MTDVNTGEGASFVDRSLEGATRVEKALIHLAKAIELDLVDVTLDPSVASNGSRDKYAMLGSKLAEIAGISFELVHDIADATGLTIEGADQLEGKGELPQPALPPAPLSLPESSTPEAGTSQHETADLDTEARSASGEGSAEPVEQPAPTAEQSKAEPQTSSEQEQSSRRLHEKIIDLNETPVMRPVDEAEAIHITVGNDNTIIIKERSIGLSPNETFLLNALLLLRDKPRSSSELRALGFEPEGKTPASTAFANTIRPLMEKLNQAAGKEIIKKLGERRGTQYAFNPRAVLSDLRGTDQELVTSASAKKN